jgi:hypothetical protein
MERCNIKKDMNFASHDMTNLSVNRINAHGAHARDMVFDQVAVRKGGWTPACELVRTNLFVSSPTPQARSQLVAGSAPMNKKTFRIARSVSIPGGMTPPDPFEPPFRRACERDDFRPAQKLDIWPRFDALDQIARHRRCKTVRPHEHGYFGGKAGEKHSVD